MRIRKTKYIGVSCDPSGLRKYMCTTDGQRASGHEVSVGTHGRRREMPGR